MSGESHESHRATVCATRHLGAARGPDHFRDKPNKCPFVDHCMKGKSRLSSCSLLGFQTTAHS